MYSSISSHRLYSTFTCSMLHCASKPTSTATPFSPPRELCVEGSTVSQARSQGKVTHRMVCVQGIEGLQC